MRIASKSNTNRSITPFLKKWLSALALLCFCALATHAQTLKALQKAGDKAFEEKDFYTALTHFGEALSQDENNPNLQFKYALTAAQFNAFETAETYFQKIIDSSERLNYSLAYYQLAEIKKSLGKYNEAADLYTEFLQIKSNNKQGVYVERAKQEQFWCQKLAKELPTTEAEWTVEHLGKSVNTTYSEINPYLKGDTLYYASLRFEDRDDKHVPKRKYTKTLSSKKGAKGRTLSRGYNLTAQHTAHTAFSRDGKRIYFTVCDYVNASQIRCDLHYREKDKRGNWKRTTVKLPEKINLSTSTQTHPAIAYDSLTQKEILYFTSDRVGGQGGLDIWVTEIDGKKFSKPKNLEQINTEKDELTPFFHQASHMLYFSSNQYPSLGGYDVFMVQKDSVDYLNLQNAGSPINTSYNDLYYHLTADGKTSYLSSNRPGSFYLDKRNKACCNDIYKANLIEPIETPVDSLPEIVVEVPITPTPKIIVKKQPETLQDFLPLALYFDNDEPDKRTRKTTTKKTYQSTFKTYYSRKFEYMDEFSKGLGEERQYTAETAIDDFFEEKVKLGSDHLYLFSNILLKRLQQGESVEIFVKGFTSPRAKSDYNLALGQRRVSSVRNHFKTFAQGIFQDDLEDLRGSVYSPFAAQERRVELVEVTIK